MITKSKLKMELSNSQKLLLQGINKNLEKGDIRNIASSTGFTREYVGKVLNPSIGNYNEEVVNAAIALISKRVQGRKEQLQTITV